VAAACLMVMHDMFTGLIFKSVTLRRIHMHQRTQSIRNLKGQHMNLQRENFVALTRGRAKTIGQILRISQLDRDTLMRLLLLSGISAEAQKTPECLSREVCQKDEFGPQGLGGR